MILLAALLQATPPPPMDMAPFTDEAPAARAMEAHLNCLAREAYERRAETREAGLIAADVVRLCEPQAIAFRAALADVYRRKPRLMPSGEQPDEAAANYVSGMNGRIEPVIRLEREHRNARNR